MAKLKKGFAVLWKGEALDMDRRMFILGILAAAAGGGPLAAAEVVASPAPSADDARQLIAALPDDLPLAYAQNPNQSPHWHHRNSRYRHHPRHVRRRRVCRTERDRHGRHVQRCRWVWI